MCILLLLLYLVFQKIAVDNLLIQDDQLGTCTHSDKALSTHKTFVPVNIQNAELINYCRNMPHYFLAYIYFNHSIRVGKSFYFW